MDGDPECPCAVINLLGGFECTVAGGPVALTLAAQRLLAFLALEPGRAHRSQLARGLWPRSAQSRAAANLRSALWQIRRSDAAVAVCCQGPRVWLGGDVVVDIHTALRRLPSVLTDAEQVIDEPPEPCAPGDLVRHLRRDLLTGWDDEWLDLERERWDSARLHALERLALNLLRRKSFHLAHEAALEAVALEPIRESAHRLVVEIHLAEGNVGSGLAHYQRYRALLDAELGVAPSDLMEDLVRPLTTGEDDPPPARARDRGSHRGRAPRPRHGTCR